MIISQRTMEWHKRKKQLKREAAEKAKNEAREATKLANERHAESKMKFKQWEQQKSQCPGKDFEIPKHRQAWMSAPPSPTEELQPTNPLQYSLLSPPNLYAEYSFYQKAAPEFVLKYPNFVASGGRTYTLAVPRKSPTKTRMTKHI